MTIVDRFVQFPGTISIDTGDSTVIGVGTTFGERDYEGAQIWTAPESGPPQRIGSIKAVDPRGVYEDLELPLVHAWNGDPIVDQPYELVSSVALVSGAYPAAVYARFAKFLEQNKGLVGNLGDMPASLSDEEWARVPNNSWFLDSVTRVLYEFRGGVLTPIQVIASQWTPRGPYDGGTTYAINDMVQSGDGLFVSNADGNVGHAPVAGTSDAYWTYVPLPKGGKYFAVSLNALGADLQRPDAGELLGAHEFIATVSFPAGFAGSSFVALNAPADGTKVVSINKVVGEISTEVGTITWAIGETEPTLAGAAVVFPFGTRLEFRAPAVRDSAFANIIGTLAGTQDGGATTDRQGQGSIDFGAEPGDSDATLVITGQSNITTDSVPQAWIAPKDTADHTADEHRVAGIFVSCGEIVAGVGFTIYAHADDALSGLFNVAWRWD